MYGRVFSMHMYVSLTTVSSLNNDHAKQFASIIGWTLVAYQFVIWLLSQNVK